MDYLFPCKTNSQVFLAGVVALVAIALGVLLLGIGISPSPSPTTTAQLTHAEAVSAAGVADVGVLGGVSGFKVLEVLDAQIRDLESSEDIEHDNSGFFESSY